MRGSPMESMRLDPRRLVRPARARVSKESGKGAEIAAYFSAETTATPAGFRWHRGVSCEYAILSCIDDALAECAWDYPFALADHVTFAQPPISLETHPL
jgi:hypothetical protein